MNKLYLYVFFISVTFISIILQTTVLSPLKMGVFYIDYSLIAVIYISLFPEISGLILLAFFSGYTIDVLSAADVGVYTISRVSLYIFLRLLITKVYSDKFIVEFGIILLSVVYERLLLYLVTGLENMSDPILGLGFVIENVLVNAVAGYLFFYVLKEINERIKT